MALLKEHMEIYRKRLNGLSVSEIALAHGLEPEAVQVILKSCQPEVREELRGILQDRLEAMLAEVNDFKAKMGDTMTADQHKLVISEQLEIHDRVTKLLGLNASPLDGLADGDTMKFVGIVMPAKKPEEPKA